MKLDFNQTEIQEVIEYYYRTFKSEEVKAKVSFERAELGYGKSTYDGCLTTFTITGTTSFLGKQHQYEDAISEEELKKMFKRVLKQSDFNLTTLTINSGVHPVCSGYGIMERTENQAYFDGITVEGTRQKGKQYVLKKEGNKNE